MLTYKHLRGNLQMYVNEERRLEKINSILAEYLDLKGITHLSISSVGNSIATGLSFANSNAPLLARNTTLQTCLEEYGIKLETHQFSRWRDNNEERTLLALINNQSESEFNQNSWMDYKHIGLMDEQDLEKYYSSYSCADGMRDIILKEKTDGYANIVIANMGTGSLLNNWDYKGRHPLTGGIKRDRAYIRAFLSIIQAYNRQDISDTQVYLCGAPMILGTNVTNLFINNALKDISREFANVTYVKNFPHKMFYRNDEGKIVDGLHYDEEEYFHLLYKVEDAIITDFILRRELMKLDTKLFRLNAIAEERNIEVPKELLMDELSSFANKFDIDINRNRALLIAQDYLLERRVYDFWRLDKETIKEAPKLLRTR